MANYSPNKVVD